MALTNIVKIQLNIERRKIYEVHLNSHSYTIFIAQL